MAEGFNRLGSNGKAIHLPHKQNKFKDLFPPPNPLPGGGGTNTEQY